MAFRGPDARHIWANDHVGLDRTLFRAGAEFENEAQPCSLGADVWITADARIDGRGALVQRLRERGCDLSDGAPDAELILHAYLAWGDQCLDHLIGDFALLLWDGRRERLLAGRDQLGVAQLFYSQAGGTLLVGNVCNPCCSIRASQAALDEQTLADIALLLVTLDDAATGYSVIRRMAPGHKLVCDRGGRFVDRYWTMRRPARPIRYRRREDYSEHFRVLFDEAVGDRLRSDRAGCQLSGGMDSSSIAVTAHQRLRAGGRPFDLRAFSIEYPTLIPDEEGRLAAPVASHSGFPVEVLNSEGYLRAAPPAEPARVPPDLERRCG